MRSCRSLLHGGTSQSPSSDGGDSVVSRHPIEVESYRILAQRVDLSSWPEHQRPLVARVIHATADLEFATSMRIGRKAVAAAIGALRRGAPVVCDSHMLRVGLTGHSDAVCLLDEVPVAPEGSTRAAAATARAAERHPDGAVWAVGNAPTALAELLRLCGQEQVRATAIVGLPVGFVGAAEAKASLWASEWGQVAVTNLGEKGGTAAAAAAINALTRMARHQ
jgi:precorrin-8X/cobalt-precorrin-8 methylmutase